MSGLVKEMEVKDDKDQCCDGSQMELKDRFSVLGTWSPRKVKVSIFKDEEG